MPLKMGIWGVGGKKRLLESLYNYQIPRFIPKAQPSDYLEEGRWFILLRGWVKGSWLGALDVVKDGGLNRSLCKE